MKSNSHINGNGKLGGCTGKGFMPGKSGNPKGRPKIGLTLAEQVRAYLADKDRLPKLLERLYIEDPKTLLAYGFGKPVETHEISGPQGESLIDPVLLATAQELAKRL